MQSPQTGENIHLRETEVRYHKGKLRRQEGKSYSISSMN